ncbi:MAG: hypothetical protein KDK66_04950 [Deltaproteobacteria bacterium]|nr:hypothetical protein [Deltaproteobacteria bacterium]
MRIFFLLFSFFLIAGLFGGQVEAKDFSRLGYHQEEARVRQLNQDLPQCRWEGENSHCDLQRVSRLVKAFEAKTKKGYTLNLVVQGPEEVDNLSRVQSLGESLQTLLPDAKINTQTKIEPQAKAHFSVSLD